MRKPGCKRGGHRRLDSCDLIILKCLKKCWVVIRCPFNFKAFGLPVLCVYFYFTESRRVGESALIWANSGAISYLVYAKLEGPFHFSANKNKQDLSMPSSRATGEKVLGQRAPFPRPSSTTVRGRVPRGNLHWNWAETCTAGALLSASMRSEAEELGRLAVAPVSGSALPRTHRAPYNKITLLGSLN